MPRVENRNYLDWIRSLHCLICHDNVDVIAAHIRYQDSRYGKRQTGKGEKPSDIFVVPLCSQCHRGQHDDNEERFWLDHRIDPVRAAVSLWAVYSAMDGNPEAAYAVIKLVRL
jgi:hypothetical protein